MRHGFDCPQSRRHNVPSMPAPPQPSHGLTRRIRDIGSRNFDHRHRPDSHQHGTCTRGTAPDVPLRPAPAAWSFDQSQLISRVVGVCSDTASRILPDHSAQLVPLPPRTTPRRPAPPHPAISPPAPAGTPTPDRPHPSRSRTAPARPRRRTRRSNGHPRSDPSTRHRPPQPAPAPQTYGTHPAARRTGGVCERRRRQR